MMVAFRRGDAAWVALVVGIVVYDRLSGGDEQLTSAMHRYHQHHPWPIRLLVALTALHLLGWIPRRYDPICHIDVLCSSCSRAAPALRKGRGATRVVADAGNKIRGTRGHRIFGNRV